MPVGEALESQVIEARLEGRSNTEIARALGVSRAAVCQTLTLPHVRAAIDEANREAIEAILDLRGRAARAAFAALIRLVDGEPDEDGRRTVPHAVQKAAADSLLDRCGVTKEATVRVAGSVGVQVALVGLSPEQLQALAWGEAPMRVLDVVPEAEAK